MHKYLRIWKQLTSNAFSSYTSNRINSASFMLAKLLRFAALWFMIISIFKFTDSFVGYSKYEILLFYVTFNFIDVITQAFFRGIYMFSRDINRGSFDAILARPVNPLFYSLTRLTDVLDMLLLVPITTLLVYVAVSLPGSLTFLSIVLYILFLIAGLLIAVGIHILTAALSIWTVENENIIWFYRRAALIGSFPPETLSSFWRFFFMYILPILLIVTMPSKALLRTLTIPQGLLMILLTVIFFGGSLLLWKVSLRHYSSASS
ncbi:MAG TPA: ABC-2 family transporter protein [Patescibacteria group bacterium]|nr:ABC-2 family transporter protein [Patescibacteria group bacterium]